MRTAITHRNGPNEFPLTLNCKRDPLPAHGVMVCASGVDGWKYIGPVVEVDEQAQTYTILPVASNPALAVLKGE